MKVSVEKPGSPTELVHHGVKGMKWGRSRSKQFATQHPTGHDRAGEIRRARARNQKRMADYATQKVGSPERKRLKQVYLKHPDRATAMRMTRGEKVVMALLAGATAPTIIIPAAVGVGTGAQVLTRRRIEKKQALGRYG